MILVALAQGARDLIGMHGALVQAREHRQGQRIGDFATTHPQAFRSLSRCEPVMNMIFSSASRSVVDAELAAVRARQAR